uniref:Ovule protein n=1 Tax=Heterorhabditis bacteriophora TaxID=37862 RepID=A0A1I7XT18_HETBA
MHCGSPSSDENSSSVLHEIKSLAERGRYSNEMKRRLIRSTEVAWKYLEALKNKQLSWSVYSPISGS